VVDDRRPVLVARLDALGDVLLAGPAVRAVAASAPVVLLCGPRGRAAAELLPGVGERIVFAAPWIEPEPDPVSEAAILDLVARLRERRFSAAVILTSFHQSPLPLALLLRMAGIERIGAISEDYPGSLLDVRHHVGDDLHEVDRALSLAEAMGYRLPAGDDGRLALRDLPRPVPPVAGSYVVVHPGASVPARAWSPARHAALVDALVAAGHQVVVTGSPGERPLTSSVAGRSRPGVVDLGGATDLAGLAAVLRGAAVVVAANTGPAHLAAAVGTPVVSIFAPTVPFERWRPWGVPCAVLGHLDIGCAGCRARECPVAGHPCIDQVPVVDVVGAVERLLAGWPAPGRASFPRPPQRASQREVAR
jgi:ADP-heptose:LPS heptosyltransferase